MDVYFIFFFFHFISFHYSKNNTDYSSVYIFIYMFFFYFAEPITSIIGEPEMFIDKDSTMNLTCVVRHSPEPPTAIYWTHDHEVLNFWYINICIWNVCMQIILCSFVYMMERKKAIVNLKYCNRNFNLESKTKIHAFFVFCIKLYEFDDIWLKIKSINSNNSNIEFQ